MLQELNPSLLRMTTPKDMDFDLHLPLGTAAKFEEAVKAIPEEMRVYWRYHRVEAGETLREIARRYRTTTNAIVEANNLDGEDPAQDTKLIIPASSARSSADGPRTAVSYGKRPIRYTARRGDTVFSVADRFGISAEQLRRWNRLRGNAIVAGRSLVVFKPSAEGVGRRSGANRGRRSRRSSAGPRNGTPRNAQSSGRKPASSPAELKRNKAGKPTRTAPSRNGTYRRQQD
jgi:membrane-bound lytic murein transglycosylase D